MSEQGNIVKFPIKSCTSCGIETNDLMKIELMNFDTGEAAGVKYLCRNCRPLDEDGLRFLLDQRDSEVASLRAQKAATEALFIEVRDKHEACKAQLASAKARAMKAEAQAAELGRLLREATALTRIVLTDE